MKKITSNPATSADAKVSSALSVAVQYPDEVKVLQNATDFARIVEPLVPITDGKIR